MKAVLDFIQRVTVRFIYDEGPGRAASVAYFALAGLFPAMLLMLTFLGHVVSDAQAQERLLQLITWYLPVPKMREYASENLHEMQQWSGFMGAMAVLVMLWSSKGAFRAIQDGLTVVWRLEVVHHTVVAHIISILASLVLGALLILQFSLIALLRALVTWEIPVAGFSLVWLSDLWSNVTLMVSPLILFTIFYLLFRYLTPARLPERALFCGAAFGAVCYRIMESAFIYYVTYISRAAVLYGAAAGFIVLMLWLYVAANIFFLAAEIVYVLAERLRPEAFTVPDPAHD